MAYVGKGEHAFVRINHRLLGRCPYLFFSYCCPTYLFPSLDCYTDLFQDKRTSTKAATSSITRLELARAEGLPLSIKLFSYAAGTGNVDICTKLRELGCPWDSSVCSAAARGGHVNVMRMLLQGPWPCPVDEWSCSGAAAGGHLPMLKLLRGYDVSALSSQDLGRVSCLPWLAAWLRKLLGKPAGFKPVPWDQMSTTWAATNGHLEVFAYLRMGQDKCEMNEDALSGAASNGHLEMIHLLRRLKCPMGAYACEAAACKGSLEVLQALRTGLDPCPWSAGSCPEWRRSRGWTVNIEEAEQFDDFVSFVHSADDRPCDCPL
ncbi:unnamed protein product [Chrysoparadoxa australica]